MSLTTELLEELDLLNLFDLNSQQGGIKVHDSAGEKKVDAAKRLFEKGITTLPDGGYLTDRGIETAEQAQLLVKMLLADENQPSD